MADNFYISAESLMKRYQRRTLFRDISLHCREGQSLAITGPNGSGKSTLLHVLALLKAPTRGSVTFMKDSSPVAKEEIHFNLGFCSPIVNLYEELTGFENLQFASRLKDVSREKELFEEFQLGGHEKKPLKYYSSGMKQRLKLLCALINDAPVILLDEPGSNLDRRGKDLVYSYIDRIRKDRIIIIATNEAEEAELCDGRIELGR